MRYRSLTAMILLIPVIIMIFSGSASAEDCEDCHSSSSNFPSGGYVYVPPPIYVKYDSSYTPGSQFQLKMYVSSQSDYDVRDVSGALEVENSNVEILNSVPASSVDGGGRTVLTWEMEAVSIGSSPFRIICDYTVHFRHRSGGSFDEGDYQKILTGNLIVANLALQASPGSLGLSENGESARVNITARSNVTDLDAVPDESIADLIEITVIPAEMTQGDMASMTVTLLDKVEAEGDIVLTWTEGTETQSLLIHVSIIPMKDIKGGTDWYHEFGKYTGIASLILLIAGYFTGGITPIKKYANKIFKTAAKRVKFHCALSYEVLILSVFHLAVLIYGPFREQVWIWENILGFLALFIMLAIAVNGIFQKTLVKKIGYQNWRRIHAWGSYTATLLVIIHAINIGTHFAWLRAIYM